jgi:hypothetical protein
VTRVFYVLEEGIRREGVAKPFCLCGLCFSESNEFPIMIVELC